MLKIIKETTLDAGEIKNIISLPCDVTIETDNGKTTIIIENFNGGDETEITRIIKEQL
jgi:hypothetical protein